MPVAVLEPPLYYCIPGESDLDRLHVDAHTFKLTQH